MAVTSAIFRDAMARLGAAVNIVTTDGPAGRYGLTVSAVCSLTDAPPTVLVCVNRGSRGLPLFRENRVLCVNILRSGHADLSSRFAGGESDMALRFGDPAVWDDTAVGAPALHDAAAALGCTIVDITEVGTHAILRCQIEEARFSDEVDGLIYFQRGYHRVAAA